MSWNWLHRISSACFLIQSNRTTLTLFFRDSLCSNTCVELFKVSVFNATDKSAQECCQDIFQRYAFKYLINIEYSMEELDKNLRLTDVYSLCYVARSLVLALRCIPLQLCKRDRLLWGTVELGSKRQYFSKCCRCCGLSDVVVCVLSW